MPWDSGNAELLHKAKGIPVGVRIHNLSVGDVMDGDAIHRYLFVCGSNSPELTSMSAGDGPGDRHLLVFSDGVLDGQVEIREASEPTIELTFVSFGTSRGTGHIGNLEGVAGGEQLIDNFELSPIPEFFIEAADDDFVVR